MHTYLFAERSTVKLGAKASLALKMDHLDGSALG